MQERVSADYTPAPTRSATDVESKKNIVKGLKYP